MPICSVPEEIPRQEAHLVSSYLTLWTKVSPLVIGLSPQVCKSIANAPKARILHLPPRAACGPAVTGSNRPTTAVREDYVRKLRQRAALRQPWSVTTHPRCVSESNWPCASPQDLGYHPARAFGSKFRAITRAITHGPSGVITVSRGRSRERTTVAQTDKGAGHRPMTCGDGGGQGRGRTADLPIFSRSFEWIHLKNPVESLVPGNIVDSDVRVS